MKKPKASKINPELQKQKVSQPVLALEHIYIINGHEFKLKIKESEIGVKSMDEVIDMAIDIGVPAMCGNESFVYGLRKLRKKKAFVKRVTLGDHSKITEDSIEFTDLLGVVDDFLAYHGKLISGAITHNLAAQPEIVKELIQQ